MGKLNPRIMSRERRKMSSRKRIRGTGARPRLCIFCSGRHIYAQIIDDDLGMTLGAVSTLSKNVREQGKMASNAESAKKVGKAVAEVALARNIDKVVFDRNGFVYHGKVKALADAAREAGLVF